MSRFDGDENHVLAEIAARLELGKWQYGKFNAVADGRDWTLEALEELLDATVYLAAQIIKMRNKEGQKNGTP